VSFLAVIALGAAFIQLAGSRRSTLQRRAAEAAAATQANRIEAQLRQALSAADVLAAAIQQGSRLQDLRPLSAALLVTNPALSTIELAPDGVIRHVEPAQAAGRLGRDLHDDPVLRPLAQKALQARRVTLAGPLRLPPYHVGLVAQRPVFVPADGPRAWGFILMTIGLQPLLDASEVQALVLGRYHYELSAMAHAGRRKVILARSTELDLLDPVSADVAVAEGHWTLAVSPRGGWRSASLVASQLVLVVVVAVVAAVSTHRLVREPEMLRKEVEVRRRRLSEATRQLQAEVAQRLEAEQRQRHEAAHDALTGLPNRAAFRSQLQAALDFVGERTDLRLAVLFLDVDRFKHVNDSVGPAAGDELLVTLARRLGDCLRPGDALARVGGDEFAVLLCNVEETAAANAVADRLLAQFKAPFPVAGTELFMSASIGIALGAGRGGPADDLLRDADTAAHEAKSRGRGRHELFDSGMRDHAVKRLELEMHLRRAIERAEFVVFYQPIINLQAGHITGAEALVRWAHPDRGLVGPVEFMPLAEETGLVIWIDRWVLREAARQVREWQRSFATADAPFSLSVNLSGRQLAQPLLAEYVGQVLHEVGLDAGALKLEVTESVVMENAELARETLERLRDMGVRLLVDDFGTGYSSLSYLDRFPFHTVKIDQSFVKTIQGGQETPILRTILELARNLGMDVIAEGIETSEQMLTLRAAGCGYGQGYFFSRPVAGPAFESLMKSAPRW
jgi:diguanylate cyclase (GGDEF)-like protein